MDIYQAQVPCCEFEGREFGRLNIPGAIHHVITRGLNSQDIFLDDCDRNDFFGRLEKNLSLTGYRCYTQVQMSNHVNLLIRTSNSSPLEDLMRESFGRDARLWQAELENITATEVGMELPDAALKIGVPGKG